MMTSSRPYDDIGGSFSSRRGHANTLSISDPSHHITETIGTLYGDDSDYGDSDRPVSFVDSLYDGEQFMRHRDDASPPEERRLKLVRSISDKTGGIQGSSSPNTNGSQLNKSQTAPGRPPSQRNGTHEGSPSSPLSPLSPTLREMRSEGSQFPLGSMNNPNDIAQELSNLQALRRMSMDVSNSQDPDLLPFQNMSLLSVAPHGDDDEADPSRLLWVPAGVHPELAPMEFKNFLEKRVQSLKRRSGESMLSVDGLDRSDSMGGLRRQKSMLSRQIDNQGGRGADGYVDGAERLERKSSTGSHAAAELSLDELIRDPSKAVQKLTLDTRGHDGSTDCSAEDKPILPAVPGTGLRRSTRTTYRKGGSLKDRHGSSVKVGGDRPSLSKRIVARKAEDGSGDQSPITDSPIDAPQGYELNRVQSEPISDNHSHPNRSIRSQRTFSREQPMEEYGDHQGQQEPTPSRPTEFSRSASDNYIPQITETSLVEEPSESQLTDQHTRPFPARSSSQTNAAQILPQVPEEPPARSDRRPNRGQQTQQQQQQPQYQQASQQAQQQQPQRKTSGSQQPARDHQRLPSQTMNDIAVNPAPLPGPGSSRTDTLTFIPTLPAEEKKPDKKGKKESTGSISRPTGWKWFKSGDDKDKKKKEEEESKRSKAKALVEKAHDNVRLDVLQTSIDNVKQKGRESLLLDRDTVDSKLEDERKKDSSRKSGDAKKEKDGLFANFFGGGKKKSDRDSGGKKSHLQRPQSPEPAPYKPLVPDVDYHWTRFPILEERAIYRMAHIKLANPRRALQSQVLLSNFMYAYLAKVQAMHPQIQVPQSPQQKRLQEEERKRREQEQLREQREQEQQYLEQQQQAQESMDRYNFEYHRSIAQYADDQQQYDDGGMQHQSGDYPEDAEIYDYDHGAKDQNGGQHAGYSNDGRRQQNERDDMW